MSRINNISRITRRPRLISGLAASIAALAMIPAGASAATTAFGSSLNHEPANVGSSCDQNNLDNQVFCTHVGSYYPGTSGHAQAGVSGTIVKVRVRAAGPMTLKFKVVKVRNVSADHTHGQAKVVAVSRTLNFNGPTQSQMDNGIFPVESRNVSIKVQRGQELAIDTNNNQAEYCSDGTPGQLTFFNPILSAGDGFRSAQGVDTCLLLVQAVIKH
jgi:hypothetical protein